MDFFGTTIKDTQSAVDTVNQYLDEEDVHYEVTEQNHFPFSQIYTFPDDIVHMVISANSLVTPKKVSVKMLVEVPEPLASKLKSIGNDIFYCYDSRTGCLEYRVHLPVEEVPEKIVNKIAPFFETQGIPLQLTEISSKLRKILDVIGYTESAVAAEELFKDAMRVHGDLYLKCQEIGFQYMVFENLIRYYYETENRLSRKETEE